MTYVETPSLAGSLAQAALASLGDMGMAANPDHFAVWYEYHGGFNPELRQTIDILISNRRPIDEKVLADLHRTFFSGGREQQFLRETSRQIAEALTEITGLVRQAGGDAGEFGRTLHAASAEIGDDPAGLAGLVRRLLVEIEKVTDGSERVGARLNQSSEKIARLERALEEAQREATTDALTGLANRRHFDCRLREAAGAAMNSGEVLALLIVDIDHFKTFNDNWGHQIGDSVLRLVGTTLLRTIRGGDCPARYGGEEFAVILPATPPDAALAVGENIRRAFEKVQIVTREPRHVIGGITVSVGAACYEPGEALADLVRRADGALYQAKQAGRNRVSFQ